MPAGVGADAAVGGPLEPDPVEERLGAAMALGARHPVKRRLQADQLAPGHQRVERRLLERDADRPPDGARIVDHVVPGDRRLPPLGRSSVVSIRTVVVLPGAVRAEEGVDLALGDLEVDAGDGDDLVAELPPQPPDLDRGHAHDSMNRPVAGRIRAPGSAAR